MLKRRYLLAKKLAGKPPSEIRIFKAGVNPSYTGPIVFDAEAAEAVMSEFTARGIRLHFDYAHARPHALDVEDPDPQHQKAAGWFDLEVRETDDGPELWAVNIEWTPAAYKAIEDKEWGYFSPWCMAEVETGRVVELRNIALTNDPAMLGIEPLVADRRSVKLQASLSFEDISRAIRKALSIKVADEWPYIEAVYDDVFVYELNGKMYRRGYSLTGLEATLADEVEEVHRTYEPITMSRRPAPRDERTHSIRVRSATEDNTVQATEKAGSTMERTALILALGLMATATDKDVSDALNSRLSVLKTLETMTHTASLDEAVSEVSLALQTRKRVLDATGAKTDSEAIGKLEGWSESAKKLEEAQKDIVKLEAAVNESKVAGLIAKGIADKKITPAMENSLRDKGLGDPEWLKGHIETMPVQQALASKTNNTDESATGQSVAATIAGKKWAELTYKQKADLYRTDRKTYEALKAEHQAHTA